MSKNYLDKNSCLYIFLIVLLVLLLAIFIKEQDILYTDYTYYDEDEKIDYTDYAIITNKKLDVFNNLNFNKKLSFKNADISVNYKNNILYYKHDKLDESMSLIGLIDLKVYYENNEYYIVYLNDKKELYSFNLNSKETKLIAEEVISFAITYENNEYYIVYKDSSGELYINNIPLDEYKYILFNYDNKNIYITNTIFNYNENVLYLVDENNNVLKANNIFVYNGILYLVCDDYLYYYPYGLQRQTANKYIDQIIEKVSIDYNEIIIEYSNDNSIFDNIELIY